MSLHIHIANKVKFTCVCRFPIQCTWVGDLDGVGAGGGAEGLRRTFQYWLSIVFALFCYVRNRIVSNRVRVQTGRCANGSVCNRVRVQMGRAQMGPCAIGSVCKWVGAQTGRCAIGSVCNRLRVQLGRCAIGSVCN